MPGGCTTCGRRLSGRQRKFCCRRCKNQNTNFRHQCYVKQGARGLRRKLEFVRDRGGGCQRCGYRANHAALVWHHRQPGKKSFELSVRAMSNRRRSALVAELAKCDLLCHNCHMEVHHPGAAMPA